MGRWIGVWLCVASACATNEGGTVRTDAASDATTDVPADFPPGTCGVSGAPCCTDTIACTAGLLCAEGTCRECGRDGQPCCDGGGCNADHACEAGICRQCGVVGARCCEGGETPCTGSATCFLGMCRACGTGDACDPGAVETEACGFCGTRSRTCNASCGWDTFSECSGEGMCAPGAVETEDCARCGTRTVTCDATCSWGAPSACTGMGECEAGAPVECGACGMRTCTSACAIPPECPDGCSCDEYTVCDNTARCRAGYHPRAVDLHADCGSRSRVTCALDCGESFHSCGACPSGYRQTRTVCEPDCLAACDATTPNAWQCDRI